MHLQTQEALAGPSAHREEKKVGHGLPSITRVKTEKVLSPDMTREERQHIHLALGDSPKASLLLAPIAVAQILDMVVLCVAGLKRASSTRRCISIEATSLLEIESEPVL